ncbi:hypothetical protein ANME2D_03005 [Candidatus Methanoperedens nitroreducens]|uniref:DUF11 domain-containing protein n=1 Tax=Candidatus Methanoperedens nitratireducens TaxID=1392998 RepID=A0A062UVD8_9EURY|nr:hypothetical protein [Candidatus Methanoperedens nitroreducens]KCZ70976.1 hypothetical protein ANME2D_03005 [Candidatus Methanoperedens nitroreducens]MDJ1421654.1 hypothetical protein [Candidatus Methanoperedens sp.]
MKNPITDSKNSVVTEKYYIGKGLEMRIYIAVIVILWSVNLASAAGFNTEEIQWGAGVTGTLYRDGTLTNGEYTIKVMEFTSHVQGVKSIQDKTIKIVPENPVEPMVYLEVYKNGTFIRDVVLNMVNDIYTDPDYEFRVSAVEFPSKSATEWVMEYYNPWAKISLQKRGKPDFEVTFKFTPDRTTFFNGETVIASITLKNKGEAFAKNVDVNLDAVPLKPWAGEISKLHKYYSKIEKDESQSFEVALIVPELLGEQEFNFSTNKKFYDAKGIEYRVTNSTPITVSPRLINISKAIKDRVYLKDTSTVLLTVSNRGTFDIYNIHLNDTMHENFELRSNTSLEWNIPVLRVGEEWSTIYSVRPLEASLSGYTVPAATAQFTVNNRQYNASSQTTTVVVNGPKIILNKTVSKSVANISEFVNVTVKISNIGNIGTRFEVKDSLPDSVSVARGSISLTGWSDHDSVQEFNYTIRMNREGEALLPAAVLNYTNVEYRGTARSVLSSDNPVITVVDPSKPGSISFAPPVVSSNESAALPVQEVTAAPTDAPADALNPEPTAYVPGFGGISTLIMLLFAFAVAFRRR